MNSFQAHFLFSAQSPFSAWHQETAQAVLEHEGQVNLAQGESLYCSVPNIFKA